MEDSGMTQGMTRGRKGVRFQHGVVGMEPEVVTTVSQLIPYILLNCR